VDAIDEDVPAVSKTSHCGARARIREALNPAQRPARALTFPNATLPLGIGPGNINPDFSEYDFRD